MRVRDASPQGGVEKRQSLSQRPKTECWVLASPCWLLLLVVVVVVGGVGVGT
jgi:hypothetical protein